MEAAARATVPIVFKKSHTEVQAWVRYCSGSGRILAGERIQAVACGSRPTAAEEQSPSVQADSGETRFLGDTPPVLVADRRGSLGWLRPSLGVSATRIAISPRLAFPKIASVPLGLSSRNAPSSVRFFVFFVYSRSIRIGATFLGLQWPTPCTDLASPRGLGVQDNYSNRPGLRDVSRGGSRSSLSLRIALALFH